MAPSRINHDEDNHSDTDSESVMSDQSETNGTNKPKESQIANIKPEANTMEAELKYLDRKYGKKQNWYYAETVEGEAPPEQVDW
jgi:hypothetical protein